MQAYNKIHLDFFSNNILYSQAAIGSDIRKWWDYVTDNQACKLESVKLDREQLKNYCKHNSPYSNKECVGAVMAWGGQNRKHGQTLFSRFDEIEPIIKDMRQDQIDHVEAYKRFDELWQQGRPLGMGAAYFTKLIFFCVPSHAGFIMDQWTSKSVNLLCDEKVVHLQQGYVSKKNDYKTYDRFCRIIEDLSDKLNAGAEEVEIALFSKGGKKKAPWRQYVHEKA